MTAKSIPSHVHGTLGGYTNWKCRCDACREANRIYNAEAWNRRVARPVPDHVHGTSNGYGNYGCRCRPCTDAFSAACLDRLHRRKARAS